MGVWKPLKGLTFGKLTVLDDIKDKYHMCKCQCSCSNQTIKIIRACHLTSGDTIDCGCGTFERRSKAGTIHGLKHTAFYTKWQGMRDRCYNKNNAEYANYGGRGITVCDRWRDSITNFAEDMLDSYNRHVEEYGKHDTSLDRIDNDGSYCPENCKWSTREEQANNKTTTHICEFKDSKYTVRQLAEIFNEPNIKRLRHRLYTNNYDAYYVYNKFYNKENT